MIQIDNLNKKQKSMLNTMWSMDSLDELTTWQYSLPLQDQLLCEALMELILLSITDDIVEQSGEFPEIGRLLREISRKSL
jgi:hypothetical protein